MLKILYLTSLEKKRNGQLKHFLLIAVHLSTLSLPTLLYVTGVNSTHLQSFKITAIMCKSAANKNNQARIHSQLELQNQLLRRQVDEESDKERGKKRSYSCSSELGREEGRSLEFNALLS